MTPGGEPERRRRIDAYGLCRDAYGRVLLLAPAPESGPARWSPPGGQVAHGAGGSTADAAWFSLVDALQLPLTEIAHRHLADAV